LLLFSSPSLKTSQSDEDKLRNTYFAQSGVITVTPLKIPEPVDVKAEGKRLKFRRQLMKLEFNATLVTPFSTIQNDLKGFAEFLVYWPSGKSAKTFAKRIATESLASSTTTIPEPSPDKPRGLTGK